MKTKILVFLPLIALFSCGNKLPESLGKMKVEYISLDLIKKYPGHVLVRDVSSEQTYLRKETAEIQTRRIVSDSYLSFHDMQMDGSTLDIRQNPQVAEFIDRYQLAKYAGMGFGPRARHPQAGLTAVRGTTMLDHNAPPSTGKGVASSWSGQYLCIYDNNTEQVHYVDSWVRDYPDGVDNPHIQGMFDNSATFFYYHKDGHAYRYNIAGDTVEPLGFKAYPIVPFNSDEVLIYRPETRHLLRLDANLKGVDSMLTDIEFAPKSVFSLGKDRYLVASEVRWGPADFERVEIEHIETGERERYSFRRRQEILLIDFSTGEIQTLFKMGLGEILNVTME